MYLNRIKEKWTIVISTCIVMVILASCAQFNDEHSLNKVESLDKYRYTEQLLNTQNVGEKNSTKESNNIGRTEEFEKGTGITDNKETKVSEFFQGIRPHLLIISSISLEADVVSVGLDQDGNMQVPEDGNVVGWYEIGANVGQTGNAVIAGHVDDRNGPAVFYNLKNISLGDHIYVKDEDGESLSFIVYDMKSYPYNDAPIQYIFGPSNERNLNLITCTGRFNRFLGTHEERLVIFSRLIDEREA